MSYCIEKVEFIKNRPNWLRKVLFLDIAPTLFERVSSLEEARKKLKQINQAFKSSNNTKPQTHFKLQGDCLKVVSKSQYPVINFQITSA